MTLILLAAAAAAIAYAVGRPWTIAIPSALGVLVAGVALGVGAELSDTPLPVAVAVATVAAAFGIVLRRQQAGRPTSSG